LIFSLAAIEGVIQVYGLEPHQHILMVVLEDFGGESLTHPLPARILAVSALLRLAIRLDEILDALH
jgi:hypothetical protein